MTLALQGIPSTACDEHELVAAVRRGDDRAFEALFSRYERRITAYVAGMVGDHAKAEDITQDVFISALRRIRQTDRSIAFKPWIYEIAKNACIDEFRRNRRSQEVSFEDGDESALVARHVYIHAPAPQAAIESKQRLDDLCGAFGGLNDSHHRVLVLRELEGLSYNEIGERLGMTRAMVESTLFRARRRLSDEYEELSSGRRCARVQSLIDASGAEPLASLGVRDRRQLARHLAHCEACRRRARVGGVDESLLEPRRGLARLAALLPLPLPLFRWRRGSAGSAVARSGSHSLALVQSLPNVAQFADPSGPLTALGRAAAAAAAIAIASAGGGVVATLAGGQTPARAATAAPAAGLPTTLSITKILAPVRTSGAATSVSSAFVAAGLSSPQGGASRGSGVSAQSGSGAASTAGPVPSGVGAGGTTGAPSSGGGSGDPDGVGGAGGRTPPASSGESPAGPPAATPNGDVSVPQGVQSSGAPSGAPPVQAPPDPSATPNVDPTQVANNPSNPLPSVSAPSTGSAESAVQNVPTSGAQNAAQVQQSVPTPPSNVAVSPPSGG